MKTITLNIGNELLNGATLNTNSFELGHKLKVAGGHLDEARTIGDDEMAIVEGLKTLVGECDLLILSGGLGPTQDDITRQAVARFLKRELIYSEEAKSQLVALLTSKGKTFSEGQKAQLYIPEGCEILKNDWGTACGFSFKAKGTYVVVFPGVPKEFHGMVDSYVLPLFKEKGVNQKKSVWTWGWPESEQKKVFEGIKIPIEFIFSSLPQQAGVHLSLSWASSEREVNTAELSLEYSRVWKQIIESIPSACIVDKGGLPLEECIQAELSGLSATVSVAESCTGGGVGFLITKAPGSSEIFKEGFITYSNQSKQKQLNVSGEVLSKYGAVSEETVKEMVRGCLEASGADFACVTSGIAGPGGGSLEKPVGTVWTAVGSQNKIKTRLLKLSGTRDDIRWKAAYDVLNSLRLLLKN